MSDSVKNVDKKPTALNVQKPTKFFKDLVSEIKKVVWPTKKQVINNTLVVFAVMFVAGVFVALLDSGLTQLLKLIYIR